MASWNSITTPNLTKGMGTIKYTPGVTTPSANTGLLSGLSSYTPYLGPATAALSYLPDPVGKLNQDLSNPLSGAMTGAAIGSYGGPVGALVGGVLGLGAGTVGRAFGLGKTKYAGRDVLGGTYNQSLPMTGVTQEQYNAYNNAMNYLNNFNTQNNVNWNPIGASEYGNDVYKTKRIGHNKKSYSPFWNVGTNTGYNVMDDYIAEGLRNWNEYNNMQGDIYQGRYDKLVNDTMVTPDMDVWNLARQENNRQLGDAQNVLRGSLIRGYLDNSSYDRALKELTGNSNTNLLGLVDIGNNKLDQWVTDAKQNMVNGMDTKGNWITNYDRWKNDDFDIPEYAVRTDEGLLTSLMRDGNQYLPYQAIATGIGEKGFSGGYGNWYDNRRNI